MSGRDPWADPSTPTEPGAPYAGPPATTPHPLSPGQLPPGYLPPGYGPPGYGPPGYGYPGVPYGQPPPAYGYPVPGHPGPWAPRRQRPPGQVIASAVLAFVQAALVLIASVYVWFFASILEVAAAGAPEVVDPEGLATEGTVLALVQLLSAVLLVTAGVLALNRRTRSTWTLLVGAHALQLVLCAYWLVRLITLTDGFPGAEGGGALAVSTLFFAAGPVVGLGLLIAAGARAWFAAGRSPAPHGAPAASA